MARVTVEDCLEKVPDQFAVVHLATLRYRQLHRGSPRLVDSKNKDAVTALREIASGKVKFREDLREVLIRIKKAPVPQRLSGDADDLDTTATPLV